VLSQYDLFENCDLIEEDHDNFFENFPQLAKLSQVLRLVAKVLFAFLFCYTSLIAFPNFYCFLL
jgi:hypothetical protein